METEATPKHDLLDVYRFAVLLTGSDEYARQAIAEALRDSKNELPQLRSDRHRKAWMVTRIRRSTSAPQPLREEEAHTFPGRFSRLTEPQRSALALFYLDYLTIRDMAQVLKLSVEDLAKILGEARNNLRRLAEEGISG